MESEGRIAWVSTKGAPDLVGQPFGELNLIIRILADDMAMTFKAKNTGDQRNEITRMVSLTMAKTAAGGSIFGWTTHSKT